ncbi:MAG: TonB-dependent receptor, partial [Flavobacteriaceae bacterium]
WSISESFAAFISLTMADNQNRVSPFESRTSAYELINIGAHIDIPVSKSDALRLQLLVRNLGNQNYIPHLSRLKTIGVEQPGRNFVLSAKYNF